LKNNSQKVFLKITVKNYLKNNGQKIFEKITVKKYLKFLSDSSRGSGQSRQMTNALKIN